MDVATGAKRVNAALLRRCKRLPGPLDILFLDARQAANRRAFNRLGNALHRIEIPRGCDGKPRLDYIHAEERELTCNLQLFLLIERRTGRLLAIAQRGVEDDDMVGVVFHKGKECNTEGERM
jgi:hypothetical protein